MVLWRVLLPGGISASGRQEGPAILVSVVDTSYGPLLSGNLSCEPLGRCGSKIVYQGPPFSSPSAKKVALHPDGLE